MQKTYTFDTKAEARAQRGRIIADVASGTHVTRDTTTTFEEVADRWLRSKRRQVREITSTTYASLLKHANQAFGAVPVQRVTR
ncbi:MAG: hypothetical protein L6311_07030, partial [Cellulomonas sp.]|nr:hypothetical protein [Cellulomonas sp.]